MRAPSPHTTKANPSRGGDAKPRDLTSGSAGPPKGVTRGEHLVNGTCGRARRTRRCCPGAAQAAAERRALPRARSTPTAGNADYSSRRATTCVILQELPGAADAALKAANPDLKVLMYKNLSGMVERDESGRRLHAASPRRTPPRTPSGSCSTRAASASRSSYYNWIWAPTSATPPTSRSGPTTCSAEIADRAGTASSWTTPTRRMSWHYDVARVAKYPTDAAYQAATRLGAGRDRRALPHRGQARHPELRLTGRPTRPSSRLAAARRRRHERAVPQVSAPHRPPRPMTAPRCGSAAQSIKDAEAAGKYYLGVSHSANGDAAAPRATASRRCCSPAAATRSSRCTATTRTRAGSTSTTTRSARRPRPRSRTPSGVHRRAFTNGLVLREPDQASVRVDFGGAYTGSGLTDATSATLPPPRALVLAKAGDGAPFQILAPGTDGPTHRW